jgi:hypothetical protein
MKTKHKTHVDLVNCMINNYFFLKEHFILTQYIRYKKGRLLYATDNAVKDLSIYQKHLIMSHCFKQVGGKIKEHWRMIVVVCDNNKG